MNTTLQQLFVALARVLLAMLFIVSGFSKTGGYAGTAAFMQAHGVPAAFIVLVEIAMVGGLIDLAARGGGGLQLGIYADRWFKNQGRNGPEIRRTRGTR